MRWRGLVTEQGATVTIPAGSRSVTITGTFVAPYEPGLTPSWATDVFVDPASKTATQFVAQFTVVPPVDGSADWGVLDSA